MTKSRSYQLLFLLQVMDKIEQSHLQHVWEAFQRSKSEAALQHGDRAGGHSVVLWWKELAQVDERYGAIASGIGEDKGR